MARPVTKGAVPRRLRLTLRGWRDANFDVRPGKASPAVLKGWREMVEQAYRAGEFGVVDALADGLVSFPAAHRVLRSNGMTGLVAHVRKLQAAAAAHALQGGFPKWFDEFTTIMPRSHRASKEHHVAIVRQCGYFLNWLVAKHGLKSPAHVTRDHWTKLALQEYRTWYVDTNTLKARARLEKEWTKMYPPLAETEREELLRKERGKKMAAVNRHINAVGAMSQWLLSRNLIDHDPAKGVRITAKRESQHREDSQRGLEVEVANGLLQHAEAFDAAHPYTRPGERPDALFWSWLYGSGATTYTEGVRLRPCDIKMTEEADGTVPVWLHGSKVDARKRFTYIAVELAVQLLARAELMGYARDSKRQIFTYTEDTGRWWWDKLLAFIADRDPALRRELEGSTPYVLRHSYAICQLEAGVDIYDLMRLMGHRSIETTAMYLRRREPDRGRIRGAVARMWVPGAR